MLIIINGARSAGKTTLEDYLCANYGFTRLALFDVREDTVEVGHIAHLSDISAQLTHFKGSQFPIRSSEGPYGSRSERFSYESIVTSYYVSPEWICE